ncbi:hypothetical protein [Mesorhizobium sp. LSJC255A00]|uniref:hypothetical protein n=1 Tax=Mesorhizobium sp. LSJC255A00 TaxID=1287313 RepID=UPI0018DB5BA3|nr:hypothetical protein [Mesorhizobium sp. LSJC255A00]
MSRLVPLANNNARIVWAMLSGGRQLSETVATDPSIKFTESLLTQIADNDYVYHKIRGREGLKNECRFTLRPPRSTQ